MHTVSTSDLERASRRLTGHLRRRHWSGEALAGPDHGIRFNARIWRFVKGYLSWIDWRDDLVYAQTQRYWIHACWALADLGLDDAGLCRENALAASDYLRRAQRPEGYWEYPNPEWRGRIATVEGNYASLGLLETYLRTADERLLAAAEKWYRYVVQHIGFSEEDGSLAVNYFGNVPGGRVPNNSASALTTFAMLAHCAGDKQFLRECGPMVKFLSSCQLESGELPYSTGKSGSTGRPHFLCYQYNAFQFLNLAEYHRLTGDTDIVPVLVRLSQYLSGGLSEAGAARYDCSHDRPEVPYYTAALAAALSRATAMGIADHSRLADRAYDRLISQQSDDGSFFFSSGNYGLLSDRRSYPRNLAMILCHLLAEVQIKRAAETASEGAGTDYRPVTSMARAVAGFESP